MQRWAASRSCSGAGATDGCTAALIEGCPRTRTATHAATQRQRPCRRPRRHPHHDRPPVLRSMPSHSFRAACPPASPFAHIHGGMWCTRDTPLTSGCGLRMCVRMRPLPWRRVCANSWRPRSSNCALPLTMARVATAATAATAFCSSSFPIVRGMRIRSLSSARVRGVSTREAQATSRRDLGERLQAWLLCAGSATGSHTAAVGNNPHDGTVRPSDDF